jgi:acyl-CoA thioesterase II
MSGGHDGKQETAILKAAAEEVALVGVVRLSMDVVARLAGVSHSTLYRRFPNRDALVTELGRQTFDFAMARLQTVDVDGGPQEAAVAAFREGVRLLTGEPVMRRFLQLDSEFNATPTIFDEPRVFLVSAGTAMAKALRAAGATMPDTDLLAVAELHIRLAPFLVQVSTSVLDVNNDDAVMAHARMHLAPLSAWPGTSPSRRNSVPGRDEAKSTTRNYISAQAAGALTLHPFNSDARLTRKETQMGRADGLEDAILGALDGLLGALQLEPLGDDRFRVGNEPDRFGRVFGGQMLAQTVQAAITTVGDKPPHSLHAYFVQSGATDQQLELAVDIVRDGRSMSARRVTVSQAGRPLLIAMVSFHDNPTEPEYAELAPPTSAPDELPRVQDWVDTAPAELRERAHAWIERPPPLEMRISEPTYFFGGARATGPRSHWMRLPRNIDDPALHTVLLTYASDYLLLDMALRSHPYPVSIESFTSFSLDHSIWLHRPVRFDQWHRHTQQLIAISGHRGLVRGSIHDINGHLVASTTQEVLVRANA